MRKLTRHVPVLALAIAALLGSASTAHATSISYSGSFTQDDDHFEVSFAVAASTQVFLQTWSYAGGVDPNGNVVPAGGFAAVLSLFASTAPTAAQLGSDAGGTAPLACSPRGIDGVTGFCLDAFLSPILGPGTYRLVLTQSDNVASGPTYADGFLRDGQGNFTGPNFSGVPGFDSFIDPGGNQRTSAYALSITVPSADPGPAVPEPVTLVTLASGTILCVVRRRRMRHADSNLPETIQ